MKRKKTDLLFNIALWCCLIIFDGLICVSISEIWIRFFVPVQNVCYTHDPILGDMRCPNQASYGYIEKGYTNILKTNSLGFHDIERSLMRHQGIFRILYFGDSLISGIGVPVDYTIPRIVESALNEKAGSISFEVLNMATAEDSTCSQLLAFQIIGKQYKPDVVICHFMCDFRDNIFETHQRTRSPYFKLTKENTLELIPPLPVKYTSITEKLKRSSMLVRLFANKLLESKLYNGLIDMKNELIQEKKEHGSVNQANRESSKQGVFKLLSSKSWPLTLKMIKEFNKEANDIGARFVLVDGLKFSPNTAGRYTNKDLENFCKLENIYYIPIYEEYQGMKDNDPMKTLFLKDGHPTKIGNTQLGTIAAEKLNLLLSNEFKQKKGNKIND